MRGVKLSQKQLLLNSCKQNRSEASPMLGCKSLKDVICFSLSPLSYLFSGLLEYSVLILWADSCIYYLLPPLLFLLRACFGAELLRCKELQNKSSNRIARKF